MSKIGNELGTSSVTPLSFDLKQCNSYEAHELIPLHKMHEDKSIPVKVN